jgi:UDP-N-acetylmuramoyl-tripeptide--D-alanyl-D-alanine ligase
MIQMQLSEAAQVLHTGLCGVDTQFTGCSTDSRTVKEGELFIALRGENFDGHKFVDKAIDSGAAAAVLEQDPGDSSLPHVLVQDAKRAMGKLASAWRSKFSLPLIAVTGSNGKTTVKEMLASILSQNAQVLATSGNLNNDIGVPLTLFGLHGRHKYAVIEMGANHPGEIASLTAMARPDVALVTLCAPSHIAGFGSIDGVAQAKAEIFSGLEADGIAIINIDDKYASQWQLSAAQYKQLSFGMDSAADVCASNIQLDNVSGNGRFILTTADAEIEIALALLGLHNIKNALAAAACCIAIDIPLSQIRDGLALVHAVKGRMQIKSGIRQTRIIDDTYNANPTSLEAAIQSACASSERCWLVLGDMGELGDSAISAHVEAGELARASGIEKLYLVGELSTYAAEAFGRGAMHFVDKESLIRTLEQEVEEEVTVLVKGSRSLAMEKVVQALVQEV